MLADAGHMEKELIQSLIVGLLTNLKHCNSILFVLVYFNWVSIAKNKKLLNSTNLRSTRRFRMEKFSE